MTVTAPGRRRTTPGHSPVTAESGPAPQWYKDAVIYELHVRAFADSDGDGIGDLRGLVRRLDYLQDLGVTALWLLPFYPSPLRDDGYDISDYRSIHPSYGTMRDFRRLLREASRRHLRVITELVLAHTSDQHPWFERARRSRSGSATRDFYVWSDDPDRYRDARVIFKDFEVSNWTFDPVAGAYYWHRFYSHQPSLNYDNPAVREAMTDVVDHWLEMGVDGLRLDAVPYLYAREGTTCENLPETFAFLRQLRTHIDGRFADKMLLAEANQWPEDAVAYFGAGDTCHMAFHFPLMPRMFMAARQEDRFPIVDILADTPAAPAACQWALFLRNHDELTLEMVTDEERDYMYRVYAQDPQARVNVGIRRRLAPLLGNDTAMIQMMNGLLFSLPGTPIVYYGDEIGMGDNIYLGDRNSVRTPMQWSSDRNAGFSSANPQQLYLPVVIDPEYHAQAVNVEAQLSNPSSLLWWMKRLLALRKRHAAFARGALQLLRPDNRKVLAFLRNLDDEHLLVVVNLSRHVQCVQLDLSDHRGARPVELFGGAEFPPVGDLPYFITLAPHGFYWFELEAAHEVARPHQSLHVRSSWEEIFVPPRRRELEAALPAFLCERRWFAHKSRRIAAASVDDVVAVPGEGGPCGYVVLVDVDLDLGKPETYTLVLAFAGGERASEIARWHPEAVVCDLYVGRQRGVVYDALWDPSFDRALLDAVARRRHLPGRRGRLVGAPAGWLRRRHDEIAATEPVPLAGEQSNSSLVFGDRAVVKVVRRLEPGPHPGVEVGRFLSEHARFPHAPASGGGLEYRTDGRTADVVTVVTVEEFTANEGDGWSFVVDTLRRGFEETLAGGAVDSVPAPPALFAPVDVEAACGHPLVGPHLEWTMLLGRRTAELHAALASAPELAAFAPEPLTAVDRQAMYHGARANLLRTLRMLRSQPVRPPAVERVLGRGDEIDARMRAVVSTPVVADRIRCHGDYHLGQVLWTGRDFVVIDFEGEPARSIGQRRLKRPAFADVAGMVRSFHYAARAAARQFELDMAESSAPATVDPLVRRWYRWVAAAFVRSYLETAGDAPFVPHGDAGRAVLFDFLLLEKATYELGYEANSRPDWIEIPARGILEQLDEP